ncbi:hypothetical protein SLE2022_275810 [Rubroshorea leprosula]
MYDEMKAGGQKNRSLLRIDFHFWTSDLNSAAHLKRSQHERRKREENFKEEGKAETYNCEMVREEPTDLLVSTAYKKIHLRGFAEEKATGFYMWKEEGNGVVLILPKSVPGVF